MPPAAPEIAYASAAYADSDRNKMTITVEFAMKVTLDTQVLEQIEAIANVTGAQLSVDGKFLVVSGWFTESDARTAYQFIPFYLMYNTSFEFYFDQGWPDLVVN